MPRIGILILVVLTATWALAEQTASPSQLTQVPPKPSCHWIFNSGPCNDLWRAYNQALAQRQREELQLYVNQQKEAASSQAAAPLQEQIGNLNKRIADLTTLSAGQQDQLKSLQDQMQVGSTAAAEAKSVAHKQGLEQGTGIGVTCSPLFAHRWI